MQIPDFPVNESHRLLSLQRSGLLFSPAEERFDRITRLATHLFNVPVALISLVSDSFQWFKSAQGLGVCETSRAVSFCGHAILQEQAFIVDDALADLRFADNPLVTGESGIRFYAGQSLCAPDGYRVGTLCLIDRRPRRMTARELGDLRDLAALVEAELQRGVLSESQRTLLAEKDELTRRASIDGLTRLWNRTTFLELFDAELGRLQRGVPACLAMIDADFFKRVNDGWGHQAGDAVLVEIACRIRRAVREYDVVGRYGGEEFIVALSNCTPEMADVVCQRIRQQIAEEPMLTPAGSLPITVSIGVASATVGNTASELIAAADSALYRAKAGGRNRVEFNLPLMLHH